jgi:predicted ATPase
MIVEPLPASDALRLLIDRAERAGAVNVGADARLAAICERLDRLPLAIELAAPKLRSLTAALLLERLSGGIDVLTADTRAHRYPTLHAALAWNYAQLGALEQRVLRALSTFAGSWPLAAAEEVCGPEVVAPLDHLVAANFIARMETADGAARYWVLGVIRDYVREIITGDERDEFARLHVLCAAQLVRRNAALYDGVPASLEQLDAAVARTFDACIEDVFAAAEAARRLALRAPGIEIVAGLDRYWPARGRAAWALGLLRDLTAEAEMQGDIPPPVLASARRALHALDQTVQAAALG